MNGDNGDEDHYVDEDEGDDEDEESKEWMANQTSILVFYQILTAPRELFE